MNDAWSALLEILILLASALLLGTIAEQLRQSALLGYLLAGALVGPNVFGLVAEPGHVEMLAELGVALLRCSIGLEFSVTRLRPLGRRPPWGGVGPARARCRARSSDSPSFPKKPCVAASTSPSPLALAERGYESVTYCREKRGENQVAFRAAGFSPRDVLYRRRSAQSRWVQPALPD